MSEEPLPSITKMMSQKRDDNQTRIMSPKYMKQPANKSMFEKFILNIDNESTVGQIVASLTSNFWAVVVNNEIYIYNLLELVKIITMPTEHKIETISIDHDTLLIVHKNILYEYAIIGDEYIFEKILPANINVVRAYSLSPNNYVILSRGLAGDKIYLVSNSVDWFYRLCEPQLIHSAKEIIDLVVYKYKESATSPAKPLIIFATKELLWYYINHQKIAICSPAPTDILSIKSTNGGVIVETLHNTLILTEKTDLPIIKGKTKSIVSHPAGPNIYIIDKVQYPITYDNKLEMLIMCVENGERCAENIQFIKPPEEPVNIFAPSYKYSTTVFGDNLVLFDSISSQTKSIVLFLRRESNKEYLAEFHKQRLRFAANYSTSDGLGDDNNSSISATMTDEELRNKLVAENIGSII